MNATAEQTQLFIPSRRRTGFDARYESEAGQRFASEFVHRVRIREATGQWISAKSIIEEMRRDGHGMGKGNEFRINNSWVTPFAHRIVEEYPDLAKHFKFRSQPGGAP